MLHKEQRIAIRDRIQSLDNRISSTQGELIQALTRHFLLNEELEELQRERTELEPQLSPVWIIPPGILSYIFRLVHKEELMSHISEFYLRKSIFPITISHVCRHFRDLAIEDPCLWTVIHVQELDRARLDYIGTYLEHSGNLPLSVILKCSQRFGIPNSEIAQVMTLIQAHMYRLQRFVVKLSNKESICPVLAHLRQPAPQLTILELSVQTDAVVLPNTSFKVFGNEMDKLTALRLQGFQISWLQCDFKNLTTLDVSEGMAISLQELWPIIENSPSLRQLHVRRVRFLLPDMTTEMDVREPYILNVLEELYLSGLPLHESLALVSRIQAPNLQSLHLDRLDKDEYDYLFDRIAGPPTLFPSLGSLLIEARVSDTRATAQKLIGVYPKLRHWYTRPHPTWLSFYLQGPKICDSMHS